jgi:peroxiredoxin
MHPTHFIINKDGSIAKVMSDYKSFGSFMKVSGKE